MKIWAVGLTGGVAHYARYFCIDCCRFYFSSCTCSNPTRAALFSFRRKKVVWVSCLALFSIYVLEFSCLAACLVRYYGNVVLLILQIYTCGP